MRLDFGISATAELRAMASRLVDWICALAASSVGRLGRSFRPRDVTAGSTCIGKWSGCASKLGAFGAGWLGAGFRVSRSFAAWYAPKALKAVNVSAGTSIRCI
jgi:hypothetical protein